MNGRFQPGEIRQSGWPPPKPFIASRNSPASTRAGSHPDACRHRQEGHARRSRIPAAIALLDRGYGKPPQFNTNDAGSFKRAVEMSDDEASYHRRTSQADSRRMFIEIRASRTLITCPQLTIGPAWTRAGE